MGNEQKGGPQSAAASKIAPATGKLGVMVVGLGAVQSVVPDRIQGQTHTRALSSVEENDLMRTRQLQPNPIFIRRCAPTTINKSYQLVSYSLVQKVPGTPRPRRSETRAVFHLTTNS